MTQHHLPLASASLRGLLLGCALVLGGCANGEFVSNPAIDLVRERLGVEEKTDTPAASNTESDTPPLIVGLEGNRVAMPFDSMRGQSRYYASPDGVELALVNVFVTRTVGLGSNLEGAFLPAGSAYNGDFLSAAKSGDTLQRIHEYFDKGRITRDEYACTLSYEPEEGSETRGLATERCKVWFGERSFTNRYWMDANTVLCSLQHFHPAKEPLQFFATEEQALSQNLAEGGSC